MDGTPDRAARGIATTSRLPKPTLCVINYNGEECLEACLRAAEAQHEDLGEMLLIDNASQDNSLEVVRQQFPHVRLVALKQNLGAAAARNTAVREAGTDLVLLIDNDVEMAPGCVRSLTEALLERSGAAVAMPAVCYAADRSVVQYDGANSHFIGLMALRHENVPADSLESEPHEIGSVVSACILVDVSKYPDSDLFDKAFFIYHEDHDFGYRTRLLGHSVLSVPSARCFHGAGTEDLSIRRLGYYSRKRVFYQIRNRWFFLLKNYSARTLLVLTPVLALYEMAQLVVALKKGWLGVWVQAVGSTLGSILNLLSQRVGIQRSRKQRDGELLIGGPLPLRRELTTSEGEARARDLLDRLVMAYWRGVDTWL